MVVTRHERPAGQGDNEHEADGGEDVVHVDSAGRGRVCGNDHDGFFEFRGHGIVFVLRWNVLVVIEEGAVLDVGCSPRGGAGESGCV